MQNYDLHKKQVQEFKTTITGAIEIWATGALYAFSSFNLLTVPFFVYGSADGLTRMFASKGISERIYNNITSYLKKR